MTVVDGDRLKLWQVLSKFFLDTEVNAATFDLLARTIQESSYAARVRTCKALAKRGMVAYAFGDYDLTELGETLAKQLNDQAKAALIAH